MTRQSDTFQAHPYFREASEPGRARQANPKMLNGLQAHMIKYHGFSEDFARQCDVHTLAVGHGKVRHTHAYSK